MNATQLKLCLVTQIPTENFAQYQQFLLKVIEGGVTAVQLRMKNVTKEMVLIYAKKIKTLLKPFNIPLIINDHLDVAIAVDAEGVHIGQTDVDVKTARQLLGKDKWIGLSIETFNELTLANQNTDINYIAASAVFPSKNKANCKTIWGLENLTTIVQQSKHPVVAIGGINLQNIHAVMQCGVDGVAVIGAIHDATNTVDVTKQFIQHINRSEKYYV